MNYILMFLDNHNSNDSKKWLPNLYNVYERYYFCIFVYYVVCSCSAQDTLCHLNTE